MNEMARSMVKMHRVLETLVDDKAGIQANRNGGEEKPREKATPLRELGVKAEDQGDAGRGHESPSDWHQVSDPNPVVSKEKIVQNGEGNGPMKEWIKAEPSVGESATQSGNGFSRGRGTTDSPFVSTPHLLCPQNQLIQ